MMKKMIVEFNHQRVENIAKTNMQAIENEVIPLRMMKTKILTEYQNHITKENHLKTVVRIASPRTHLRTNHPMTMTLTIGENIRRPVNRHTRKQNRKNISNHVAIRRTNVVIHPMKMKSITRKRQKRVNVHDPDPGIEDKFVVFCFNRYVPQASQQNENKEN